MSLAFSLLIEAALLASVLSLDAFTAGFAYGSQKIKTPFLSVLIISVICSGSLGIALFAGSMVKSYLPDRLTVSISFIILFAIGLIKLLDSITKSIIDKYSNIKKEITGSFFHFKFILSLYAAPEKADLDNSNSISSTEAVLLALSLSLDGIGVGLGAGLASVNIWAVFLWSFITNAAFLVLGHFLGHKSAQKMPFNISWLSGVVLMGLAFSRL